MFVAALNTSVEGPARSLSATICRARGRSFWSPVWSAIGTAVIARRQTRLGHW